MLVDVGEGMPNCVRRLWPGRVLPRRGGDSRVAPRSSVAAQSGPAGSRRYRRVLVALRDVADRRRRRRRRRVWRGRRRDAAERSLFWAPPLSSSPGPAAARRHAAPTPSGSSAPAARSTAGSAGPASCCSPLASFLSYARAARPQPRSFVVVAVPALDRWSRLLGRYAARSRLRRLRARGRCTKRVVVVGRGGAVLDLVDARSSVERYAGMDVVAACVTARRDRVASRPVAGVPVGGLDDVVAVGRRTAPTPSP